MIVMNNLLKILKKQREKKPPKRISVKTNALKLTIPRRFNFSGHFHLNMQYFGQKWWEFILLTS